MRKYNVIGTVYSAVDAANNGGSIIREKNLNGFQATNVGDTVVFINECILTPGVPGVALGDSITFGGNQDEIYLGLIKVRFQTPLGAAPAIEIVQKFYTE